MTVVGLGICLFIVYPIFCCFMGWWQARRER